MSDQKNSWPPYIGYGGVSWSMPTGPEIKRMRMRLWFEVMLREWSDPSQIEINIQAANKAIAAFDKQFPTGEAQ